MFHFEILVYVPGDALPVVVERIMNAQTTESEKTDTHVFSVYISMASVKEKRVRLSAQFLSLSASAAYNALPWNIKQLLTTLLESRKLDHLSKVKHGTKANMMKGWLFIQETRIILLLHIVLFPAPWMRFQEVSWLPIWLTSYNYEK